MGGEGEAGRELIRRLGGCATTRELLKVMTRDQLDWQVRRGGLVRVWWGVYAVDVPDLCGRLVALDLFLGREAVACLGTAAALYGFDVEGTTAVHIVDPGTRVRPTIGLAVHQRVGAPIRQVAGRLATAPAWTAVEVARRLPRPRALATLDAAVHSGWCRPGDLADVVAQHRGRRGIVTVRELLPHVDGRAESAMESEARLVMTDHGLPKPQLQYVIHGDDEVWRVDFAWPDRRVVAEYDGVDWHVGRTALIRDRKRTAAIQQLGWTVVPIVADDVRRHPGRLAARLAHHLAAAR